MIPHPTLDQLATVPFMLITALIFAVFWSVTIELSRRKISISLTNATWWPAAVSPTTAMMQNFGFPKEPNKTFPKGVTEPMVRDFYADLIIICLAHAICVSPMIPVVIFGWDQSSELVKVCFILGTLGDVGFDIYDAISTSLRTFSKNHPSPTPIEFWFILVCMHHTTALLLVLPLNMFYVHRSEYHQTAVSLLLAASLCYLAGAYKFTLNVFDKKKDFYLYKIIVLFQLAVILYTRLLLWFPSVLSLRAHMKEQEDTTFFYGATVMITIFSLFNVILVVDALGAAVKWMPRKFPKSKDEKTATEVLVRRTSATGIPAPSLEFVRMLKTKRKFKGAVHSVILANRLSSQSSEKED